MKLGHSIAAALSVGVLLSAGAFAQEDDAPQLVRQELMEEVGSATGVMGRMLRGQTEFDAEAVLAALETIRENATVLPDYFPEGSETGFDTEAAPAIWENKDEFNALYASLAEDAEAAIAAAPQDLASLEPLFGAVTGNCSACHDDYRLSDD